MAEDENVIRRIFLAQFHFTQEQFDSAGVPWDVLCAINDHHRNCEHELRGAADYVTERLREIPDVHSIKIRIKGPERVMAKIVRKRLEGMKVEVSVDNYPSLITDLIGLRALHLFKGDWSPIHDFVTTTWELQEPPIAYVREGDADAVKTAYGEAGCDVRVHPFGYRSVHYLLKLAPAKRVLLAELQVRTLFEEAWSEVDHRVRYPRESDNPHLNEFLTIFNRIAGSADEMATFIQALSLYLTSQEAERAKQEQQMEKLISESKASADEKASLKNQLDELRRSTPAIFGTGSVVYASAGDVSRDLIASAFFSPVAAATIRANAYIMDRKCKRCGQPILDTMTSAVANDLCVACRTIPGGILHARSG